MEDFTMQSPRAHPESTCAHQAAPYPDRISAVNSRQILTLYHWLVFVVFRDLHWNSHWRKKKMHTIKVASIFCLRQSCAKKGTSLLFCAQKWLDDVRVIFFCLFVFRCFVVVVVGIHLINSWEKVRLQPYSTYPWNRSLKGLSFTACAILGCAGTSQKVPPPPPGKAGPHLRHAERSQLTSGLGT